MVKNAENDEECQDHLMPVINWIKYKTTEEGNFS